ncbi:MAG: hypothetical protein ACUZ8I_05195 [Candidatus Scalindua sp.]
MPNNEAINYTSITIIIPLIGFAGTIIGVIIGYFLSGRTAKKTVKLQEFNKLTSKLRIALIDQSRIIKRIEFIKTDTYTDKLDVAFTNTETAFIEFRFFLCKRQRERINSIWHEYNNKQKTHKDIVKFHAHWILESMDKNKLRENLLINIEKLIEFIRPK